MIEDEVKHQMERIESDFIDKELPKRMWPGVNRYLLYGIKPGDFLYAVVQNSLSEAVHTGDDENLRLLPNYVHFFYNCIPGGCWGSKENVTNWIATGGFTGGKG